jgi:hypothetical protein
MRSPEQVSAEQKVRRAACVNARLVEYACVVQEWRLI